MRTDGVALKTRVVKSVAWYGASRVVARTLSWIATILSARFLTPEDYGLFAMALTVTTAIELLHEFGLGTAIVQRRDLTPAQLNSVFWFVMSASTLVVGILFLVAPLAAAFYAEPRLTGIVRACALSFLFYAAGLVSYSLLTKAIDFRRRSVAESVGAVASTMVVLGLAWWGFGVWALVLGFLTQAVVRNVLVIAACGWRPGLGVTREQFGDILAFGARLAGAGIVRSLSPVLNRAIVGRMLSGPALGMYAMADSIASGPNQVSSAVIQQLSLPVFSRLQTNDEQLRSYFLRITKYLFVIAIPVQVGIALVAPDLVPVLLGPQWQSMVGLLQILSLGAIFYVVTLPGISVLVARGRPATVLRFNTASTLLLAASVLGGSFFGLIGVGLAWLVAFAALRLVLLSLVLRELRMPVREYARGALAPAIATVLMVPVVLVVAAELIHRGAAERLILQVVLGAATYAVSVLLIDRGLGRDLRTIVHELFATSRPSQVQP